MSLNEVLSKVAPNSHRKQSKKIFTKFFNKQATAMMWDWKLSTKDIWNLVLRVWQWLDEDNMLSIKYFDKMKEIMDIKTRTLLIQRFIKSWVITRRKKWEYLLNPWVAMFWYEWDKEEKYEQAKQLST